MLSCTYAMDSEALYVIDLIAELRSRVPGSDMNDLELSRRPLHVYLHGILSEVVSAYNVNPSVVASGRSRFVMEFAAAYVSGSAASRAGDLALVFRHRGREESNLTQSLLSAGLGTLPGQRVEEAMAIFGPGGSESLGDYEDLAKSPLYRAIYDFLLRVRLSIFELESSIVLPPVPLPRVPSSPAKQPSA